MLRWRISERFGGLFAVCPWRPQGGRAHQLRDRQVTSSWRTTCQGFGGMMDPSPTHHQLQLGTAWCTVLYLCIPMTVWISSRKWMNNDEHYMNMIYIYIYTYIYILILYICEESSRYRCWSLWFALLGSILCVCTLLIGGLQHPRLDLGPATRLWSSQIQVLEDSHWYSALIVLHISMDCISYAVILINAYQDMYVHNVWYIYI